MTPEHEMIILKYIEQVLHKNFSRNSGYKITPEAHWVETCIQELFDEWKNGGHNFAKWLSNNDRQLFDSEKILGEMIMYNNNYYKRRYNYNWMYQVDNLYPNTIINTYASIYAYNQGYDIITDIVLDKTRELIVGDVIEA
jgi:hypothetical protein